MESFRRVAGEGLLRAEYIHHKVLDDEQMDEKTLSLFGADHGLFVFEHEGEVDLEIFLLLLLEILFLALDDFFLDFPVEFVSVQDEELLSFSFDISDEIPNLDNLAFYDLLDLLEGLILQELRIILVIRAHLLQLLVQNPRLNFQLLADQQRNDRRIVVIIFRNGILQGLENSYDFLAFLCKGF